MTTGLLLAAALSAGAAPRDGRFVTWRLEDGRVRADAGAPAGPLPVGSLVKPFLAEAWAHAHPEATPPRFRCESTSHCWKVSGHGELGLARALALSCNAYFRALATDTPPAELETTLREEGFQVAGSLSPEAAIGLSDDEGGATIEPARLLRAYARLVTTPWSAHESVRREVIQGLREAARLGTARLAGGVMGKTGTVPSLDGRALSTSGWALRLDESGRATLGLLVDGTGREAAATLGARGSRSPTAVASAAPAADADRRVSVLLLSAIAPRAVVAHVAGPLPAPTSRGFLGPGATVTLRPGDRLGDSLWELKLPERSFVRRVRGRIAVEATPAGTLRLRAEVTREEYVAGILLAELPEGAPDRRLDLAAAALRFLGQGPRHGATDVCDTTHCAWFLGRGPRVLWPTPATPVLLREPRVAAEDTPAFDAATWARILLLAKEPGPLQWTSHCGGAPLSAHFVWGNGDRRVWPCPRHTRPAPWSREWPDRALARVFGSAVRSLEVVTRDGVWTLDVRTSANAKSLRFDDVHRGLATVLGQDALPSPATRVMRITDGFRVEGIGSGHRVGLCLAD